MAEVSPLSVPGLHSGAAGALSSNTASPETAPFSPQTDAFGVEGPRLGPAEGAARKSRSPILAQSLPGRLVPDGSCLSARSRALQVSVATFAGCAKWES